MAKKLKYQNLDIDYDTKNSSLPNQEEKAETVEEPSKLKGGLNVLSSKPQKNVPVQRESMNMKNLGSSRSRSAQTVEIMAQYESRERDRKLEAERKKKQLMAAAMTKKSTTSVKDTLERYLQRKNKLG